MSNSTAPATAGLVVIGNEILSGKVTDTNTPYLCRELRFLGVELRRITVVPDEFELIGETVRAFSEQFTWVFTSGGIGPTHDDVTVPAIAAGMGVPAVRHPALVETIEKHYAGRLTEEHLLMAQVPEGAELIEIPGLYMPQVCFRNIFILPGVPQLFQHKFNAIKQRFQGQPVTLKALFLKADEGVIAALLGETEKAHPGLHIGSYPTFFRGSDHSVKVTLESRDARLVQTALEGLLNALEPLPVSVVRVEG